MPTPRRSTHSSLEALETRIAPASLTASVVNGVLKITALSAASAVQGFVTFIDPDSVLVNDGPTSLGQFDGVHSVKITLSDQQDGLNIFSGATFRGPVSIAAGAGQDFISFGATGGFGISGDVSIVAKANASVNVGNSGKISGTLSVTTGAGGFVGVTQGTVGSLVTTDVPQILLDPSSYVAGTVRVAAPDGGVSLTAGGTIGGNLFVKGSTAANALDTVHLNGVTNGSVSLVFGEGASLVDSQSNSFMVGDNLMISGKSGPDGVNLSLGNSPFTTNIGGTLKISLGDGSNSILIGGQGRIGAGLRAAAGIGNDTVQITNSFVSGVARFDLGAGTNALTASGNFFNGGLVVMGGVGNDAIQMTTGQNTMAGPTKFYLGDGFNTVNVGVGLFEDGLSIKGGKDGDTVSIGGSNFRGKTTFSLGAGNNSFGAASNFFRSNFYYLDSKAGNDSVIIDASNTLTGSFTMNAGDGANFLVMNTLGDLSSFSYKGGKDSDTVALEAGGGFGGSNPLAGQYLRGKIALGDGNDFAVLRNSMFLSLAIDPGTGVDQLNITTLALAAGPVIKAPGFETTNTIP